VFGRFHYSPQGTNPPECEALQRKGRADDKTALTISPMRRKSTYVNALGSNRHGAGSPGTKGPLISLWRVWGLSDTHSVRDEPLTAA
jgi:hypothetical protein